MDAMNFVMLATADDYVGLASFEAVAAFMFRSIG